jgi:uncharacterized protein (DUF58 family)
METSELIKKVRKIEIKTKGLSNHIFSGEYHSAFKGRGMNFSEVREYAFGDDVKAIDWNVTARYNKPFIKIYEEERELTVMLLVDVSESAFFGTKGQMKNEMITEICAVLAFSVINNNDKVGVIFFSDKIDQFIPPKKGKSHVLRIIRELIAYSDRENLAANTTKTAAANPDVPNRKGLKQWWQQLFSDANAQIIAEKRPKTDISKVLKFFSNVIKRRSTAFLLSDFMDKGYEQALGIAARKHDLVGMRIYDPAEADLPQVGMLRVVDAESGQAMWLDTNDANTRSWYAKHYQNNLQHCKNSFAKSPADLISIPTNEAYVKYLISFFKKRGG